jgi:hypothetical protein
MKTACLLFLTMSWAALTHQAVLCPLPWGEGVPRPAFSPAGAGRVRGHWNPASHPTFSESSVNTANGHPGDGERAAPAADGKHPTEGKTSHEQRGHGRLSDTNHPPSRASLTKVNRSQQLPSNRQASLPGNAMNLHQAGSDKSSGPAKSGFIRNETVNNALAVRAPSVVRPTVPLLNNVRHRGPNPAVMDGSLNSHGTNTGTINGTRMNHRM